MKNKIVGYLIIGIAILMAVIVQSYNTAFMSIAGQTCSITGPECPHLKQSNQLLLINSLILIFLVAIGIYLIFFSHEERVVTKVMRIKEQIRGHKVSKANYAKIMNELHEEEQDVLENIIASEGSILQSELVSSSGLTKVKVTRILDKLEGKGIIERKRRGMTNVVILKA